MTQLASISSTFFRFSSFEQCYDDHTQLTSCIVTAVANRRASRKSLKDMKQNSPMKRLSRYMHSNAAFTLDFPAHSHVFLSL